MKIRKIRIKNYKMFDDLELDFTDSNDGALDTIVLAGINGSGKTSILQLLAKIFSEAIPVQGEIFIEFESTEIIINNLIELMSIFMSEGTQMNFGGKPLSFKKINSKLLKAIENERAIKVFTLNYKVDANNNPIVHDFILFTCFSSPLSKYFNILYFVCSSFDLNLIAVEKNSLIRLVDIFSHKKEIERYLVDSIINSVLKNREMSVKEAVDSRIKEINYLLKDVKLNTKLINITAEKAIFESFNHKEISMDDLSSGEKQLYYRAVLLSQLNINNSLVLIDEPETSLHPGWQKEIIKLYQNAGENNQLIIATHSPHIISTIDPKNLFVLNCDSTDNKVTITNMEKEQKYTKGVEPNRILQEIMGMELRDDETQERIDDYVTLLRQQPENRNTPENEEKLRQLTADLGPQDPSIMRIQHQLFLLNRKR
ncbi:MAG: AAA family ATPase [Methylococcales bacterium]|nr:AAA family ATPase [Methylococcales bacterium]